MKLSRLVALVLFAAAMAWMESATVLYLRTLVHRIEPYQASPMPAANNLGSVEIIREGATLLMLGSAGFLGGKSWRSRFGSFLVAFGVWDILYYAFLAIIVGWPKTLFDWDVLFLIPLPWWGPVLSPILVSCALIAVGFLLIGSEGKSWYRQPSRASWGAYWIGTALALYAFMQNSIEQLWIPGHGELAALPTKFNWPLLLVGLAFMLSPIFETVIQVAGNRRAKDDVVESERRW